MPPPASTFADRARSFLHANASRPVIGRAARVAGALLTAASAPFGPQPYQQPPANIPPPAYSSDQPVAPQGDPEFRSGYHDHTFTYSAAPQFFGGKTIEIAREDIELHDSGASFWGSSALAAASTRHPTVFSALGIRCAPSIALPRQILGGTRGLARLVREEVEMQLCPRMGLLPSACFPSTLWGTIAIDLALMGFAVLQHVYGPPDARGIRRIFTRRWPTWAVYYQAYRRTYVAITNQGPIDIVNDGKFTLIGKTDVPHLQGAIRALMLPMLDGVQVMQARAQWIDRFSDPKFIATMPPDIAPASDIGRTLYRAIETLRGPGAWGVLPHGTTFEAVGLEAKASACFGAALRSDDGYINSILTGVDTGADGGVYKPLVFWGILRSTVGDDLAAQNRGINLGHVYPYTRFNHAAGIEEDIARGTWIDPVLDTPLPDPEADARAAAYIAKLKGAHEVIKLESENGYDRSQERTAQIFAAIGEPAPILSSKRKGGAIYQYHIENKIVAPDQVLEDLGLPPLPDGMGTPEQLAKERAKGGDEAGALAKIDAAEENGNDAGAPPPNTKPPAGEESEEA